MRVVRRRARGASIRRRRPCPRSGTDPDLLDAELARGFLEIQRAENASLHGPRGNPSLWTGEAVFSIISLMIRDFAPVEERVAAADRAGLRRISRSSCAFRAERRSARSRGIARPDRGPSVGTTTIPALPLGMTRARRMPSVARLQGADVLLISGIDHWLDPTGYRLDVDAHARAQSTRHDRAFERLLQRSSRSPNAPESAMACGPDLFDLLLTRGHFCTAIARRSSHRGARAIRCRAAELDTGRAVGRWLVAGGAGATRRRPSGA